jgi:hypothetical protein
MNEPIKTFKQQLWNPQLDVVIYKDGSISVGDHHVETASEIALSNIILRLNASITIWQQEAINLREEIKQLKIEKVEKEV